MIVIEEVNGRELKTVCRELNTTGVLADNIKWNGVKKDLLMPEFIMAIESLTEDVKQALPKSVVGFYS